MDFRKEVIITLDSMFEIWELKKDLQIIRAKNGWTIKNTSTHEHVWLELPKVIE
jgi:hypothetical protein